MTASLRAQLQDLVRVNKVFPSDPDFINIMGVSELTQPAPNKLMDEAATYGEILGPASYVHHHHHMGDSDYPNLPYPPKPTAATATTTTTNTTTTTTSDSCGFTADILVSLEQILPDVYFTQGTTDLASPVPLQYAVPEEPSGESPSYMDLTTTHTYTTTLQNPNETYVIHQEKESPRAVSDSNIVQGTETPKHLGEPPSYFQSAQSSQAASEPYTSQTSNDSNLSSELYGTPIPSTTDAGTLVILSPLSYSDHQALVPVQSPLTDWSPGSSTTCHDVAATPMSTTPMSTSSSSSESGEALTTSPASSFPSGSRGRRQSKAGGPVRGAGRARRTSGGPAQSTSRKRKSRERKTKLYEREEPFEDLKAEKKRQDAINSKKNRDKKKEQLEDLKTKVQRVLEEKEELKRELETLRKRETELRNQYMNLQHYLNPCTV